MSAEPTRNILPLCSRLVPGLSPRGFADGERGSNRAARDYGASPVTGAGGGTWDAWLCCAAPLLTHQGNGDKALNCSVPQFSQL